ncbi:MAG: ABC transporter ATP-binding protein [Planctomycetota bacterium]
MAEHALEINRISKSFVRTKALDDVSFGVPSRSVFGLLGPNGAGKTTLFSLIASFIHPDGGTIRVLGSDVEHISELHGRLSILPQDALFQRNVPILEQLTFFRLLDGKNKSDAEAEVKHTLELVGLGEYMKRGVHALSHGMINRLGLAQAFLGEPEVILLDEPTSGLDPQNARQIRDLIRTMQTRNATVMISSHNLAEIQELCDHVAILDEGKLVSCGSVEEMTRASRLLQLELSRELSEQEVDRLLRIDEISRIEDQGKRSYELALDLRDSVPDRLIREVLRALLDMGITPRQITEGSSLEDFFLKVTGADDGS